MGRLSSSITGDPLCIPPVAFEGVINSGGVNLPVFYFEDSLEMQQGQPRIRDELRGLDMVNGGLRHRES